MFFVHCSNLNLWIDIRMYTSIISVRISYIASVVFLRVLFMGLLCFWFLLLINHHFSWSACCGCLPMFWNSYFPTSVSMTILHDFIPWIQYLERSWIPTKPTTFTLPVPLNWHFRLTFYLRPCVTLLKSWVVHVGYDLKWNQHVIKTAQGPPKPVCSGAFQQPLHFKAAVVL